MALTRTQEIAKRAVRFAVHKLGGGRSAEQFTGIDDTRLSRFKNDNTDDHIYLFQFLDLDEATAHEALRYLAAEFGLEVITEQQKRELCDIARLSGRVAQTGADFLATALEAGSDGVCTNNEVHQLDAKYATASAAQNDLRAAVIQMPRTKAVRQ